MPRNRYQNVLVVLQTREMGLCKNSSMNILLKKIAEEKAACSELHETRCKLPTSVRSTFLMSFSPDSTKVASTHGDHKIYVCDVKTGKLLHKLEGHPRTPWCLAFHPTSNDILASGCLGGEVRVWHLHGGSERWGAEHNTVITSLAFHPLDKVLVIATYNQIHFWQWSLPEPFATCRTGSEREKVRFVKFDQLGNRLITGISNLPEPYGTYPLSSGESASGSSNNANRNYRRATLEPLTSPLVTSTTGATVSQRRQLLARLIYVYHRIFEHSRRTDTPEGGERSSSPTVEEVLARARVCREAIHNSYLSSQPERQSQGFPDLGERERYRCILQPSNISSGPSGSSIFRNTDSMASTSRTADNTDNVASTNNLTDANTFMNSSNLTSTSNFGNSSNLVNTGNMTNANPFPNLANLASTSNFANTGNLAGLPNFGNTSNQGNASNSANTGNFVNSEYSSTFANRNWFTNTGNFTSTQAPVGTLNSSTPLSDFQEALNLSHGNHVNVNATNFITTSLFQDLDIMSNMNNFANTRNLANTSNFLSTNNAASTSSFANVGSNRNFGNSSNLANTSSLSNTANLASVGNFPNTTNLASAGNLSNTTNLASAGNLSNTASQSSASIPRLPDPSDSDEDFLVRAFWRTFHRLRFCCTSLEMRIQQLQRAAEINANMPQSGSLSSSEHSISSRAARDSSPNVTSSGNGGSSSGRSSSTDYLQMTSDFLMSTLTRFQNSLQGSAVSGAFAEDQIQQVQGRISEILERLNNVTGYRHRLNTLREQIYEVAERNETNGEDTPYLRSSDLAHCLWLIEMSLQLTQHLQRILHADYRLTQLHMSSSSPTSTSNESSNSDSGTVSPDEDSEPRSCMICGSRNQTFPIDPRTAEEFQQTWDRIRSRVRRELGAVTERIRNSSTAGQALSATNENRLLRILNSMSAEEVITNRIASRVFRDRSSEILDEGATIARLRSRVMDVFSSEAQMPLLQGNRAGESSNSPAYDAARRNQQPERTLSDNSDDDDLTNNRNQDSNQNAYSAYREALDNYHLIRLNSAARQAVVNITAMRTQQSNFHLPEVNIVPSSTTNDSDPLPVHERPRSPPLPTILSGASDHVSSWFNAVFDGSTSHLLGSHETVVNYSHRVQSWDFSKFEVPEISNAKVNVVVPKCKIHNDASIDISKDGELLVALVPSSGSNIDSMMFAVYSLNPKNLGHCLYNWPFDSNAISVSFSPLGQYIVIGLASPRLYLSSSEKEAVAQIFKLKFMGDSCVATHVRSLTQQGTGNTHHPGVSLNSVQWLPQPGQGLIYGTNRGCLSICKPVAPMTKNSNKILKVSRNYEGATLSRRMRLHFHRMFSAPTQTTERGTQTTGTQTLGTDASSSSSHR